VSDELQRLQVRKLQLEIEHLEITLSKVRPTRLVTASNDSSCDTAGRTVSRTQRRWDPVGDEKRRKDYTFNSRMAEHDKVTKDAYDNTLVVIAELKASLKDPQYPYRKSAEDRIRTLEYSASLYENETTRLAARKRIEEFYIKEIYGGRK